MSDRFPVMGFPEHLSCQDLSSLHYVYRSTMSADGEHSVSDISVRRFATSLVADVCGDFASMSVLASCRA